VGRVPGDRLDRTRTAEYPQPARLGHDGLVPQLSALPVAATFDGELVAFGDDGRPDFPLLCERMLMRKRGIPITYMVFDLLSLEGRSLLRAPYSERRTHLAELDLDGVYWQTPETFDDGRALFEAVCQHELEGVLAKRRGGHYQPGERAMGEDEEPRVLAPRPRARISRQEASRKAVRLTHDARAITPVIGAHGDEPPGEVRHPGVHAVSRVPGSGRRRTQRWRADCPCRHEPYLRGGQGGARRADS
jgi:hypothetical protein